MQACQLNHVFDFWYNLGLALKSLSILCGRLNGVVCVLTRKYSGMNGEEIKLLCNIEWRFEDGRWRVFRKQIFLRSLFE